MLSQLNVISIQNFVSVDSQLVRFTLHHFQLTQDGTVFIVGGLSHPPWIQLALQKQTCDTSSTSFHLGPQVYYKRNDGKGWHGPGVIAGIDGKIVLIRHGGSMFHVSPVHLLPGRDADKQRAKDTLSESGQDGLPQSGKVPENLSCDKGAQADVLVTIDDVINDEDSGLHITKDPKRVPGLPIMVILAIQWLLLHMMKCVLLNQKFVMEMHLVLLS